MLDVIHVPCVFVEHSVEISRAFSQRLRRISGAPVRIEDGECEAGMLMVDRPELLQEETGLGRGRQQVWEYIVGNARLAAKDTSLIPTFRQRPLDRRGSFLRRIRADQPRMAVAEEG